MNNCVCVKRPRGAAESSLVPLQILSHAKGAYQQPRFNVAEGRPKSGVAPPIANPPRRESILVVYGEGKGQLADQIRSWFLNEGYNSSATSTDFTELGKAAQAPGTVKLRFMPSFASKVPDLTQKLSAKFPELGTIQSQQEDKLAPGDAQLLLF